MTMVFRFPPTATTTTFSNVFRSTVLVALIFLSFSLIAVSQPCGRICRFRLCQADGDLGERGRVVIQRAPQIAAQGPVICSPKEKLGYVRQTGEAIVAVPGKPRVPISDFKSGALEPPFSPKFFSVRRVPALQKSAIVKAKSRGKQQNLLDGLCILLPVLKYERLFMKGTKKRIVKTNGSTRDCVSFRARVPVLLIELSWTGPDDLDLAVINPRGDLLSRFNRRDSRGGRISDDAPAKCDEKNMPVGKELVRYWLKSDLANGLYTVQVRHFENCGKGATPWTLRVTVADRVRVLETGKTDAEDSFLVKDLVFEI